ncbi:hypothetical protein T484DRAFT_1772899 [Baffinella frigidus]|nr:hypothetical protein T484DRAFT_1772899 [Cryptophyta sp. CCMP2293]
MKKAGREHILTLRAAGGPDESEIPGAGLSNDRSVTHHVIKFHPMDKEYVRAFGHEWLFKREAPPPPQYEGKHKKKLSNMEVVEPEKDTGDWKRPWMITKGDDTEFNHAFCARREAEERSNDTVLIHCTLARSKARPAPLLLLLRPERVCAEVKKVDGIEVEVQKVEVKKVDGTPAPDHGAQAKAANERLEQIFKACKQAKAANERLEQIFKACERRTSKSRERAAGADLQGV